MQSNYNPEKKLSKKTTVIRRIERRTPNGKLISTTKSVNIFASIFLPIHYILLNCIIEISVHR